MRRKNIGLVIGGTIAALSAVILFNVKTGNISADWSLHIVFFSVGQADAMAIVSPEGEACVIDAGNGSTAGKRIVRFLKDRESNGFGEISLVKYGFATHYDADHIGGFKTLADSGITFQAFYDQGRSYKRQGKPTYNKYLTVTGDLNDNLSFDEGETGFIRARAGVGQEWHLGAAIIKCLSVRGDTHGSDFDLPLDPTCEEIDENPGSIALLITLGDFEFYTAGDQTSDDWKNDKPDTEIAVVLSGAFGSETDIDVLKVNHHGSDTSTGQEFVKALRPEVAIISSKFNKGHKLPKMISIMQLVENQTLVYITGNGQDSTGAFTVSNHTDLDNDYTPDSSMVINDAGDVHIFVSADGRSYTVETDHTNEIRKFSSVDSDNVKAHPIAALKQN